MRRVRLGAILAVLLMGAVTEAKAQEPNFGRAIVMTDAELFVGQPVNWYGPGVVYAYRLDSSGDWVESARLTASDASRKDDFGRVIAVQGNTMVVGAPRKRDGSGVAYVFERESASADWRQVAVVEPPADGDHSDFAAAVAVVSAEELLVGSPAVDSTGVVYQLRRDGTGWAVASVIRAEEESEMPGFGGTIAQQGDRLLIGAPGGRGDAGQAYFFDRQADGSWAGVGTAALPTALAGARAGVGSAVALDGDRAYIAVPGEAAVYYYDRDSEGAWSRSGSISPFDESGRARFGYALAVVGDELWVGAPTVNRGNGRIYRYIADSAGGWQSVTRLDAEGADGTHWPFAFGYSIAGAGDRAVIGMPLRDFGEGRALAVSRSGGSWSATQTLEGEIFRIGGSLAAGTRCQDGMLEEFPCSNMELVSHMPISALGGERGVWVNDVWGWTDRETGRNYALVARRDGASFVDVTNASSPRLVGNLPRTPGSPPSVWRDIKVIGDHAYVVSDGAGAHGIQVFDLTRLRSVGDTPVEFEADSHYDGIFSAHNIVADTSAGFLYVVGANSGGETCGGGLHMVDARYPNNLTFAGCYNDRAGASGSRGYTHDAQCLVYEGPDTEYNGRQICVGSNEKEINIADVTDKDNPVTIGRASYPNVVYAHQGWFDPEQRYFYQNDENDEAAGVVEGTRTLVWDLSKLDDPILVKEYIGPVRSSDHNLFVVGDRVYESNYGSGLRVLDISDRANPKEIAHFDSAPMNDNGPGHSSSQSGAWSNYPFFGDGLVVFTSVREGLFIVRVEESEPTT
jgi:choice-of-anchor B domain-containing protein